MSRINANGNAPTAAAQLVQRARQAAEAAKPIAAQVKPLAGNAKDAAGRGLHRSRAWAAPQVERSGQMLQDTVAPKVAAALASTAQWLEPEKPAQRNNWRTLAGVSALVAAAAVVVAALRKRIATNATAPAGEDEPAAAAEEADPSGNAEVKDPARTS
jgi:hypothetical protein